MFVVLIYLTVLLFPRTKLSHVDTSSQQYKINEQTKQTESNESQGGASTTNSDKRPAPLTKSKSLYLNDDNETHSVWKPEHGSLRRRPNTQPLLRQSLLQRRRKLLTRVQASQLALKYQREEMADDSVNEEKVVHVSTSKAKRMKKLSTRDNPFHSVVSQFSSALATSDETAKSEAEAAAHNAFRQWKSQSIRFKEETPVTILSSSNPNEMSSL